MNTLQAESEGLSLKEANETGIQEPAEEQEPVNQQSGNIATAEPPKTLEDYAKAILDAHQSVEATDRLSKKHGKESIAAATKAGKYLNDAKALVGHGKWLKWLAANCKGVSDTTAQRYMKIAKNSHVNYLTECTSLRQAYILTGAIKAGHLDKNPDESPTPDENEPAKDETPQTILAKLGRQFAGCQNLYKSLQKASPDLEGALFDTCEMDVTPLPILLGQWHHSVNDILSFFGLPTIQVACTGCGNVKTPDAAFGSIYPNVPEYSDRLEWCEACLAYHALWTRRCESCGTDLDYGMEDGGTVYLPPLYANQYKSLDCSPTLKKRGDAYFSRFPDDPAIIRYVDERHSQFPLCNCKQ